MKLRNKKTGEIYRISHVTPDEEIAIMTTDGTVRYINSLAELNEEWEDYEEPKEDYIRVINSFINYVEEADDSFVCDESVKKFVEKLKAWKRLEDKGFKFYGYGHADECEIEIVARWNKVNIKDDLDLLFGGKE